MGCSPTQRLLEMFITNCKSTKFLGLHGCAVSSYVVVLTWISKLPPTPHYMAGDTEGSPV